MQILHQLQNLQNLQGKNNSIRFEMFYFVQYKAGGGGEQYIIEPGHTETPKVFLQKFLIPKKWSILYFPYKFKNQYNVVFHHWKKNKKMERGLDKI